MVDVRQLDCRVKSEFSPYNSHYLARVLCAVISQVLHLLFSHLSAEGLTADEQEASAGSKMEHCSCGDFGAKREALTGREVGECGLLAYPHQKSVARP